MAISSIFDGGELRRQFHSAGINPNFIPFIWKYVVQNPNCDWDDIPSLPSAAYPLLRSHFKPSTSSLHTVIDSSDNVTTKLLIKLQVLAFYDPGFMDKIVIRNFPFDDFNFIFFNYLVILIMART